MLYRARAQSNAVERALVKSGVPYRVIGGHRFYDTQEVRDAMAYLRVIQNPADSVSLRRIINTPRRGIGDTTMDNAAEIASGLGITVYEVLRDAANYPAISRAAGKIGVFIEMMDALREIAEDGETLPHDLYRLMLEKTGYMTMWQMMGPVEAGRVENLQELESSLLDYEQNSADDFPTLAGFLEEAALMTDVDNYDASADSMVLMTMHAAKGLEFPVVFLPGFEDGLFPGRNSIGIAEEMEEERRLCYVAITRAKEKLYISRAFSRMLYGMTNRCPPSRFLKDIPATLLEEHDLCTMSSFGGYGQSGYRTTRTQARKASAQELIAAAERGTVERASHSPVGSAIERQKTAAAKRPSGASAEHWAVGDIVRHKVFGRGKITVAQPMGNDTLLTITFDSGECKKIMANFAHLERTT